ncbi:unannotated protein [freshwater metagenome]|uniref:Unannotated protein n=1 Tax=freshwater metagenome TaxID=449393 RepID=A0A6J7GXQ4_9ZZZZ
MASYRLPSWSTTVTETASGRSVRTAQPSPTWWVPSTPCGSCDQPSTTARTASPSTGSPATRVGSTGADDDAERVRRGDATPAGTTAAWSSAGAGSSPGAGSGAGSWAGSGSGAGAASGAAAGESAGASSASGLVDAGLRSAVRAGVSPPVPAWVPSSRGSGWETSAGSSSGGSGWGAEGADGLPGSAIGAGATTGVAVTPVPVTLGLSRSACSSSARKASVFSVTTRCRSSGSSGSCGWSWVVMGAPSCLRARGHG